MTSSATVVFDPDQATPQALVESIKSTGYGAELPSTTHTATEEQERQDAVPDQKRDEIARLQREGRIVAMVGDGINDAPALIAIGTGTDVAIEAGDINPLRGDLRSAAHAIELSRATMRTMRQNLFWALAYNAIGIPLAAGVLYPIFGMLLSPVVASAAMAMSSVSVVSNSLRLRREGAKPRAASPYRRAGARNPQDGRGGPLLRRCPRPDLGCSRGFARGRAGADAEPSPALCHGGDEGHSSASHGNAR
jgi:hypothetical protein